MLKQIKKKIFLSSISILLFLSSISQVNPKVKEYLLNDKVYHATAGAFIASNSYLLSYKITDRIFVSGSIGISNAFIIGSMKEHYDYYIKKTKYSTDDLITTTYGGITGLFTCGVALDMSKKKKEYKNELLR